MDQIKKLVEKTLSSLHEDYFPEMDFNGFLQSAIFPGSKYVEWLSFRVRFLGGFSHLITAEIIEVAEKYFGIKPKYFDTGGIRFSFPSSTSDGHTKIDNYTYTPMHYDIYGEMNTLTYWVPLDDVNFETGGLMWSHDLSVAQFIKTGLIPTSSSYHQEKLASEDYLKILRNSSDQADLRKGGAYVFDKSLLHGGAYSRSKSRISADFRLLDPRSPISDNYRPLISDLSKFPKFIEFTAFDTLIKLGDRKFIKRFPFFRIKHWLIKPRGLLGSRDSFPFNAIKGVKRILQNWF